MGSTVATITSSAPSIAASTAAAAGLITAPLNLILPGVGAVLGIVIGGLFAGHARRVAGAKQENQVLNSLIPTVQQAVATVFNQLNSGQATPQDAIAALDQIQQQYWQAASQVESGPGQAGGPSQCVSNPNGGLHITGTASVQNAPGSGFSGYDWTKGKSCTASCGIGCMWVRSWTEVGKKLIQAGGGTVTFDAIPTNKYGLQSVPALSISYTPGAAGSVTSALSSVFSGTILGLPSWIVIGAGLVLVFLLFLRR